MKELKDYIDLYTPYIFEGKYLKSLNESNIHKLLDKHTQNGYIIISPCRGGEDFDLDVSNTNDLKELQTINNKRIKDFIQILKKSNWSYMPVYGGFIENKGEENETTVYEKSFMIFNYDKKGNIGSLNELFDFGVEMSKKFNQDSFLYHSPGETPKYFDKNGELSFEIGGNLKFGDYSQTYFTDLYKNTHKYKGKAGKETRFTFTECYVNPKPYSVNSRLMRDVAGEIFLGKW